jgi:hypothetical protein
MVIIDERDFIKRELEAKGFSVFDYYDQLRVLDVETLIQLPLQRRSDLLLVDTDTLLKHPALQENFKAVMNTFLGVVFFNDQKNTRAQTWVQDHAAFLTKIIGEYSLPMPDLNWTMLSNQLTFFVNLIDEQKKLQKHLLSFSQELDQVLQSAEGEMDKAKRVHEMLVPKRFEEVKGVRFSHRYVVGDGGGGEFFDLVSGPQKVCQVLVASQSYLISSALMGLLNQHKLKDFDAEKFLEAALGDVETINASKKKKSEVEVSILELDLTHLTLRLVGSHKLEVYSSQKGRLSLTDEPQALTRGDKLIALSPGYIHNWRELQHNQSVHSFIQNQTAEADLLTELFFQIRGEVKGEKASKKDATIMVTEVNRHGIHEV